MKVDLDLLEKVARERTKCVWAIGDLYEERINKFSRNDEDFFITMEKNIDAMIAELKMYREAEFHAEQSAMYDRKHNDDGSGNES